MATRLEMVDLIELVRGLINDPAVEGGQPEFTDEQIQNELDIEREYFHNLELIPLPNPDGTINKWHAPSNYWDKGAVISDSAGTVLMPSEASYIAGQFTLTEEKDELGLTGFCYDVFAVCSGLLTIWAGRIGRDITKFSADGSSYEFAGEVEGKLKLASLYTKKSKKYGGLKVLGMVRNDHVID
jgi:hypothetical protein